MSMKYEYDSVSLVSFQINLPSSHLPLLAENPLSIIFLQHLLCLKLFQMLLGVAVKGSPAQTIRACLLPLVHISQHPTPGFPGRVLPIIESLE